MKLIVLRSHGQLLPDGQQVVQCIVGIVGRECVADAETVLPEGEDFQSALMEVAVELLTLTGIAALVQVMPDRSHGRHEADTLEGVVADGEQILRQTEECHAVQVGQYRVQYSFLFCLTEGVTVQFFQFRLVVGKLVERH